MFSIRRPDDAEMRRLVERLQSAPYTYREVGDTRNENAPPGFAVNHYRVYLGQGLELFHRACQAVTDWQMFPSYLDRFPAPAPLDADEIVAARMRGMGLWVSFACRIVYTIDDIYPNGGLRFGFAYGTLPGHVERGEERFVVDWLPDDSVWYDLYAFSRPQSALSWLGFPITRWFQRRFAVDSCRCMTRAVWPTGQHSPSEPVA